MVNTSRQQLNKVQHEARKYRQGHLETVAKQYADQNNLSKHKAIIELLSHEEARHTFKTIRQRVKHNHQSQLKALWVSVDDQGNYTKDMDQKTISTDKAVIHTALLRWNAEHLGQEDSMPFARGWKKQ